MTKIKKDTDDDEENKEDKGDFYKHSTYEKRDLYKEDLKQYSLDALDVLMDTTHFTSQEWRQKQIDIHTQDPHLRKLVLKDKSPI